MSLLFRGSKLSYFILFTLSLPILINTEYIVNLWLGQNPDYTTDFIRLVLILSMSEAISTPLITAILATGKIKKYQIIVGGLNMMNLPISYILLRYGMSPNYVFITAIILSQLGLFARLYLLRGMIGLNSIKFIKDIYARIILTTFISFIPPLLLLKCYDINIITFITISLVSVLSALLCAWLFGITADERKIISRQIAKVIHRFRK